MQGTRYVICIKQCRVDSGASRIIKEGEQFHLRVGKRRCWNKGTIEIDGSIELIDLDNFMIIWSRDGKDYIQFEEVLNPLNVGRYFGFKGHIYTLEDNGQGLVLMNKGVNIEELYPLEEVIGGEYEIIRNI